MKSGMLAAEALYESFERSVDEEHEDDKKQLNAEEYMANFNRKEIVNYEKGKFIST